MIVSTATENLPVTLTLADLHNLTTLAIATAVEGVENGVDLFGGTPEFHDMADAILVEFAKELSA